MLLFGVEAVGDLHSPLNLGHISTEDFAPIFPSIFNPSSVVRLISKSGDHRLRGITAYRCRPGRGDPA